MACVHGVSLLVMMATSSLAMVIPNSQTQPQTCATGDACFKSFSRSYVNNVVLCCPNGGGLTVANFGNTVHCECGSGGMNFNGGSFLVNGQLLDHPMPNATNTNFRNMMTSFEQQMSSFRQQMAGLGASLHNMFNGLTLW